MQEERRVLGGTSERPEKCRGAPLRKMAKRASKPLFFFFFHPIYYGVLSSPLFLHPSRNSDPGSHSRLCSPSRLRFMPCLFLWIWLCYGQVGRDETPSARSMCTAPSGFGTRHVVHSWVSWPARASPCPMTMSWHWKLHAWKQYSFFSLRLQWVVIMRRASIPGSNSVRGCLIMMYAELGCPYVLKDFLFLRNFLGARFFKELSWRTRTIGRIPLRTRERRFMIHRFVCVCC